VSPRAQIIVSTHFDDAALSLAHVLLAAGPLATVVTVCGGAPPDGLPVSAWDAGCGFASGPEAAQARAAEDTAACAATGARPLPLDHPDSPYGPLPDAATLRAEIEPLLRGDCTLWLPSGIGNSDHAHVRDALLPLAAHRQIYADLPYAGTVELAHACEVRLTDDEFEQKLTAVRCHASQLTSLQASWPDLLERDGPLARERFGQVALAASATWPVAHRPHEPDSVSER
jgi:LmbE family N-acetylglucosaminyl deacetylase